MSRNPKLDDPKFNEVLDAMRATADFLFKVPNASRHLHYVAIALREYLSDKYQTTDEALGLRFSRGQYERPENEAHIKMICDALPKLLKGEQFKAIAELNGYAEKEFRRLFNRYRHIAIERLVGSEST